MNNETKKSLQIILDSTSGFSKQTIEEKGFAFLPLQVFINEKSFLDGENIDSIQLLQFLNDDKNNIKTSQPIIGKLEVMFEELSQDFDYVIYLPLNKFISSTSDVALKLSQTFPNIKVIENKLFGSAIIDVALKAKEVFEKTQDIEKVQEAIADLNNNSFCYIAPKNLDAFIKGGRLKGTKKFILEKAGLIPGLYVEDDNLKIIGIKRSFEKLVRLIVGKIIDKIEGSENVSKYNWEIIHTGDIDSITIGEKVLKELGIEEIHKVLAPSIITIHTGFGAIAINVWKK